MDEGQAAEYVSYLRKSNGRKPIPRQRALTAQHIEGIGGRITDEFTDADRTAFRKTGEDAPEREGFDRLLVTLAASPGLGLAAYHADRITRSPEDTERIIRVCAAGRNPIETYSGGRYEVWTATGRKRLRDDATAAAYEVDHGRERVLAGRAEVAQQGRWLGGKRPFGWERDPEPCDEDGTPRFDDDGDPVKGILRLVPAEAHALEQAHAMVLQGSTLAAIAREWNAAGIATSLGRQWRPREVGRVLRRARNAGLMEYQGEIIGKASWPAIVSEETWRATVAILADPQRRTTPGPERRHLLSGIAVCGVCGHALVCSTRGGRGRARRYPVYRCGRASRGHVTRSEAALDDLVTRLVIGRLSQPDAEMLLRPDTGDELAALRQEKAAVEALMREANELRLEGLLNKAEFADGRRRHLERLERIARGMEKLAQADRLASFIADPAGTWESAGLAQRRTVIGTLLMIAVMPAPKGRVRGWQPGRPYFDPESVFVRWRQD